MPIKRVLLPLCTVDSVAPIIESAFVIGSLLSAQVRGLLAHPLPVLTPAAAPGIVSAEMLRQIIENASREHAKIAKSAQEMFEDRARSFPHVEAEFASVTEPIGQAVGHGARLADVSVIGSGKFFTSRDWRDVCDAALIGSGRPVLLVPPEGVVPGSFERVTIAWRESIEAARAVAAAQPFLVHAKEVHLFSISKDPQAASSLDEVERYLQLHYADVRSEIVPSSDEPLGKTLLRQAEKADGSLLVMGAYSHWRWQEHIFGGATEYVMREAHVPILMSH